MLVWGLVVCLRQWLWSVQQVVGGIHFLKFEFRHALLASVACIAVRMPCLDMRAIRLLDVCIGRAVLQANLMERSTPRASRTPVFNCPTADAGIHGPFAAIRKSVLLTVG